MKTLTDCDVAMIKDVIDKSVRNKWSSNWASETVTLDVKKCGQDVSFLIGECIVKIDTPGEAYCTWCKDRINYGGKGKDHIIKHCKGKRHSDNAYRRTKHPLGLGASFNNEMNLSSVKLKALEGNKSSNVEPAKESTGRDLASQEGTPEAVVMNENGETVMDENPDEAEGEGESGEPVVMAVEKQEVLQFDTSVEFAQIMESKVSFDSWEEFMEKLEEFQIKTGTSYKLKSACGVAYVNERRINHPIPERMVYSTVKMLCRHFGNPHKTSVKEGGKKRSYVGRGCEAHMNVSYYKGGLRITNRHHLHSGHLPIFGANPNAHRRMRVIKFTDDMDLTIAREVLRLNPFKNGEKEWVEVVDRLKKEDQLGDISVWVIKKRLRFLIDKFLSINHGGRPSLDDEMGCILYELYKAKETMDALRRKGKKTQGRGRPRKKRSADDEDLNGVERSPSPEDETDSFLYELEQTKRDSIDNLRGKGKETMGQKSPSNELPDNEDFDNDEDLSEVPPAKRVRPTITTPPPAPSSDVMTTVLSYLHKKDEKDRQLRHKELELRREELSFQKSRFDFEKIERKAQLDLLKSLVHAFEGSMAPKQQTSTADPLKNSNQVEYTIVVDENNFV